MSAASTLRITQRFSGSGGVGYLMIGLALIVMYFPTYVSLDKNIWGHVGQGHGPLMFALALWLMYQRWPKLMAMPDVKAWGFALPFLLFGCVLYVLGRSQDILLLDTASQIFVVAGVAIAFKGLGALRHVWFPLLFIAFMIPIPGSVVDQVTAPLKSGVSVVAEWILHTVGYPIGRSGVTLTIGQYQLLVADACAGLNSIFALEAIGVFYLSIVGHTNKLRNITLAILILPISFVSNVIRVIALVLITYYFGDAVGQGFAHDFAGILLFMAATALTIAVDAFLGIFMKNKKEGE